jgi:2-desacetyl-2-hydroxyethyl bacteriochlorophyllide A dehydrogenase
MSRMVAFRGAEQLQAIEVAPPELGANDVRLRIDACGVCGSDVTSYYKGMYVKLGQVMGHEAVGTIIETGAAAGKLWSAGQQVMVRPLNSCGTCPYCRRAEQNLCGKSAELSLAYGWPGAYAEEMVVHDAYTEQSLVALGPNVRGEDAVWAEPLAVSLHALDRAQLSIGESVAVIGAGSVGLSLTAAARTGGSQVHVVEPRAVRRELAIEAGAVAATTPGEYLGKFDVVFDTSGVVSGAEEGLRLLQPGGRMILIGVSDQVVPLRPDSPVLGAFGYRADEFARAGSLINRGKVRLGNLVTHKFALDEVEQAIITTRQNPAAGKVIIVPASS